MNTYIGKNRRALTNQTPRRMLFLACAIALMLALMVSQPAKNAGWLYPWRRTGVFAQP